MRTKMQCCSSNRACSSFLGTGLPRVPGQKPLWGFDSGTTEGWHGATSTLRRALWQSAEFVTGGTSALKINLTGVKVESGCCPV